MASTHMENRGSSRFFVTYTGVKLPFHLVNELQASEVANRNTYFHGYFDEHERLVGFDKLAYGEIELTHRYSYHDNGHLNQAEITDIDGEVTVLEFDANGFGKCVAHDYETCQARFPLSNFPPLAGDRANESLREFHINGSPA